MIQRLMGGLCSCDFKNFKYVANPSYLLFNAVIVWNMYLLIGYFLKPMIWLWALWENLNTIWALSFEEDRESIDSKLFFIEYTKTQKIIKTAIEKNEYKLFYDFTNYKVT